WDLFWWFFWVYVVLAYLIVLIRIFVDVFRDHSLNGWAKAGWVLALVFLPFITAIVYLIARGRGLSERSDRGGPELHTAQDDYLYDVADLHRATDPPPARPR
ncbi:MAG: hypothetical protein K0S05_3283, partial [Agromyces sp.]|nr:hypothetical protein [Agromyces sp.]